MDKSGKYLKEIASIIVTVIAYCFSVFVMGVGSSMLLLILIPICVYSFFSFNYGKSYQVNNNDIVINSLWWLIYVILVTLTAANILPLVNEWYNWLWIEIIPFFIVKFTNRTTIKDTLRNIGICGSLVKKPWKRKTLFMCFIITPILMWSAHGRFNITLGKIAENPTALLFFPLMFFLMMLTAGTTEEFFFRGVIQRNIYNATKSQIIAVLVSALLFALFHLPWAFFSWSHTSGNFLISLANIMTEQFPSGVFLGVVFIRSSNLWPPIILHSFINSVWATATFFTDNPILKFG